MPKHENIFNVLRNVTRLLDYLFTIGPLIYNIEIFPNILKAANLGSNFYPSPI